MVPHGRGPRRREYLSDIGLRIAAIWRSLSRVADVNATT